MPENDELKNAREEISSLRRELAREQEIQQRNIKTLQDNKEELLAQKEELAAVVEELSSQNNKLETALELLRQRNNEMDQIIYRASHDLKEPATSILGVNSLLQNHSQDPFMDDCCRHIDAQLVKMYALLNSLSSFSQVAINDPRTEWVDFDAVLNDVLQECERLPHSTTMMVSKNLADKIRFRSDGQFIRVVLFELISNAFIFRDNRKDGMTRISVHIIDDALTISVRDNGDGIHPDVRKNIFTMFYRGSDKSLGTGLGLYKVLKCVEALKGTVRLGHEKQTEFLVTLPVESYLP